MCSFSRFDHVMEEGGQTTFSQLSPEVPTTLMPSPPEPPQGKQCCLRFF